MSSEYIFILDLVYDYRVIKGTVQSAFLQLHFLFTICL